AVFPFHALAGTPFAEGAHETIRNFHRPLAPVANVALVRTAESMIELRHREAIQIHQARRVIDDETDGDAGTRIDYGDTSAAGVAFSGQLREQIGTVKSQAGRGDSHAGVPKKRASGDGHQGLAQRLTTQIFDPSAGPGRGPYPHPRPGCPVAPRSPT